MAYGYSSNPGPDAGDDSDMDSLYGDEEGGKKGMHEDEEPVDQQEREEMNETALVPLKVLQAGPDDEVKVGDERVLKVVAVHDTQAEVEYSKTPPEEIGKEGGEEHGGMHHARGEDEEMEDMMHEA